MIFLHTTTVKQLHLTENTMSRLILSFVVLLAVAACSGPKDTPVPKDIAAMEAVKPALEKLTPEERELFAGYVMRNTLGAKLGGLFGGKEGPGIPDGMTVGKAIEDQRKFKADRALEEANQAAVKEKLRGESEAAMNIMRKAVTVTLVSKTVNEERGMSGMLLDENFQVTFGYKNNSPKDIAGVKGYVSVKDLFGDEISGFAISNDKTIKSGESITWTGSRSVKYAMGSNKDRKLAELTDDKYKITWEPKVVVFSDGTKLVAVEQ